MLRLGTMWRGPSPWREPCRGQWQRLQHFADASTTTWTPRTCCRVEPAWNNERYRVCCRLGNKPQEANPSEALPETCLWCDSGAHQVDNQERVLQEERYKVKTVYWVIFRHVTQYAYALQNVNGTFEDKFVHTLNGFILQHTKLKFQVGMYLGPVIFLKIMQWHCCVFCWNHDITSMKP